MNCFGRIAFCAGVIVGSLTFGGPVAAYVSEKESLDRAVNYAIDKDYSRAFRVVKDLIEDAEQNNLQGVADRAYEFLKSRNLIANEALADISFGALRSAICDQGIDSALSTSIGLLNSKFGKLADPTTRAQKSTLIKFIQDKYRSKESETCASMKSDRSIEEQANAAVDAETLRVEKQLAADSAAEEKRRIAERIKAAPGFLREMTGLDLCETYGNFLRGATIEDLKDVRNAEALFSSELSKRGYAPEKKLVIEKKVRIGMSECGLYAAWGSPSDSNRSVGPWGVHLQLIWGSSSLSSRTYVYVRNGKVSSFQD